jgi:hypothetical protein
VFKEPRTRPIFNPKAHRIKTASAKMCEEASVIYTRDSAFTQGGCNLAHYSAICFAVTGAAGHVNLVGFTEDSKPQEAVGLVATHQSGKSVDASTNNIKCSSDMSVAAKSSFVVICVDGGDVQACGEKLASM